MRPAYRVGTSPFPLVTTAIHAGHELRPAIADRIAIDEATRRREEDPFTDQLADVAGSPVVVHRSRFEIDLNRPRASAVYSTADAAWGLDVWREPLPRAEVNRSLAVHDSFYAAMAARLDELAMRGPFVVLDVHSYNHRRDGPDAAPAPEADNPEINVGTGSLDRERWGDLVDRVVDDLRSRRVCSRRLDVRENVRFEGGYLSRWVHERYPGVGCALALDMKKVFMDEWTGEPDDEHLRDLNAALAAAVPVLLDELAPAS